MAQPDDHDPDGARVYDIAERRAAVEQVTGVELVDAETADLVPAEPGGPADVPDDDPRPTLYATVTWRRDDPRPPIVPAWLLNPQQRRMVVRALVAEAGYLAGFHAARTVDSYSWRFPAYALRGAWRITWRTGVWASGVGNGLHALRQEAATRADYYTWEKAEKHRIRLSTWRLWVLGVCLLVVLLGVLAVVYAAPWWLGYLVAVGVLPPLIWAGRPADKPILIRTVPTAQFTRLTAEQVRNALVRLRITGITDPGDVDFPPPGVHREGPGWLARVNLPGGVEAVKVIEARAKLSSALRLPVDQVWPSAGPEHAGQVDLWVGYQPASKMGQPRWSLASPAARTSYFEPFVFATDERQRPITATLFETNWLVGGRPGSGKSYATRAVTLGAALDPTIELMIAEHKGTGDFLDLAPLCSAYVCGVDDEAFDAAERIVGWGLAECERRGRRIKAAKERGQAPKGKVTPELAARRGSGLHPVVIVIDEAHELFLARPDVAKAMERLIRRGRALGITVILSTQIPDKDSVPPNISRCVGVRWCLAVSDQVANDMILGTGAYKRGLTATSYRTPEDQGWGVLTGLGAPGPAKGMFPNDPDLKVLVERATALRGGVVGGGLGDAPPRRDFLTDLRSVFFAGEAWVSWPALAERLAETHPQAYASITPDAVSSQARGLGVESVSGKVRDADGKVVKRDGRDVVARGAKLAAVDAAIDAKAVTGA